MHFVCVFPRLSTSLPGSEHRPRGHCHCSLCQFLYCVHTFRLIRSVSLSLCLAVSLSREANFRFVSKRKFGSLSLCLCLARHERMDLPRLLVSSPLCSLSGACARALSPCFPPSLARFRARAMSLSPSLSLALPPILSLAFLKLPLAILAHIPSCLRYGSLCYQSRTIQC